MYHFNACGVKAEGSTIIAVITVIIGLLAVVFGIMCGVAALAMVCWNAVAPLWDGPAVTFWQSLAVLVLVWIVASPFRK